MSIIPPSQPIYYPVNRPDTPVYAPSNPPDPKPDDQIIDWPSVDFGD